MWHGYEKSTWVDMCEHMSWHAESDLNRWYNVMQSPDKPKTPRIWTLTVQTNSWTASLPHNSTQLMIYIHLFTFGAKPSIFTTPVTSVNQDHSHSVIQDSRTLWTCTLLYSLHLQQHCTALTAVKMAPGGVPTAIPCVLTAIPGVLGSMQQLLQSVDKQDLTSAHCNPSSKPMCPHCNTRCPHLTAIHLAIPGLLTTIPIAIAGGVLTAISHHNPSCSVIPITKSLQYLKQSVDKQAIYWHPPKKHRIALLPKVSPKNLACGRKTLGGGGKSKQNDTSCIMHRIYWVQCTCDFAGSSAVLMQAYHGGKTPGILKSYIQWHPRWSRLITYQFGVHWAGSGPKADNLEYSSGSCKIDLQHEFWWKLFCLNM